MPRSTSSNSSSSSPTEQQQQQRPSSAGGSSSAATAFNTSSWGTHEKLCDGAHAVYDLQGRKMEATPNGLVPSAASEVQEDGSVVEPAPVVAEVVDPLVAPMVTTRERAVRQARAELRAAR